MKRVSLIVLVCICALFFSPLAIAPSHAKAGNGPSFITLDVCNASGVLLPGDADTPSLHEAFCGPLLYESASNLETIKPPVVPFQFALQLERPPQA
jgi:hypothetical protein